jgi:uncharacterized protein
MTEQEQQLISNLAERIKNSPAPQIDRDAYDLILHTIGTRTDALYILTQTVLLQEMALSHAKAQIDELQRQPQGYSSAPQQGGFLPGTNPPPAAYQAGPYQGGYQGSSYAAPPPPQPGGGFSGFLHNVATTAAGVIAGDIAFDAISSMFGHRGGGFFGGGGGFLGGGGGETIVNNYYGDDQGDLRGGGDSRFAQAADQDQNISSDIDDERDNSGDNFSGGDDSSGDDFSGGDDGGSSDS